MKRKKNLFLWLILILVVLGIARYGTSSWRKYNIWQTHQTYFEQAPEDRKIEIWMTPNFIKRHYKIKVSVVIHQKIGFWEERKPLSEFCLTHRLDCNNLIQALNTEISK